MKKVRVKAFIAVIFLAKTLSAGPYAGATFNVISLLPPVPSATAGFSGSPGWGLGSVFGGYSFFDFLSLGAYLSSDSTGNITGTGTFLGTTGVIDGRFRIISYGLEARLSFPGVPFYFRFGAGLGSLRSEFTVVGLPTDPFAGIRLGGTVLQGGIGFSIPLPIRILIEAAGVYATLDSTSLPAGITLPGLLYFKGMLGAAYYF